MATLITATNGIVALEALTIGDVRTLMGEGELETLPVLLGVTWDGGGEAIAFFSQDFLVLVNQDAAAKGCPVNEFATNHTARLIYGPVVVGTREELAQVA